MDASQGRNWQQDASSDHLSLSKRQFILEAWQRDLNQRMTELDNEQRVLNQMQTRLNEENPEANPLLRIVQRIRDKFFTQDGKCVHDTVTIMSRYVDDETGTVGAFARDAFDKDVDIRMQQSNEGIYGREFKVRNIRAGRRRYERLLVRHELYLENGRVVYDLKIWEADGRASDVIAEEEPIKWGTGTYDLISTPDNEWRINRRRTKCHDDSDEIDELVNLAINHRLY